jgi:hypothetical protein
VPARFDLPVSAGELLERPRRRCEELEFVLGFSLGDAVGSDQAILVAHDGVLHAADREFREAVDAQALEEFPGIGSLQ